MLNKLCVSNDSGKLYIYILYIYILYIYIFVSFRCAAQHPQGTTFNISTTAQRGHVTYSSWISLEQKIHWLLFHLGTISTKDMPT